MLLSIISKCFPKDRSLKIFFTDKQGTFNSTQWKHLPLLSFIFSSDLQGSVWTWILNRNVVLNSRISTGNPVVLCPRPLGMRSGNFSEIPIFQATSNKTTCLYVGVGPWNFILSTHLKINFHSLMKLFYVSLTYLAVRHPSFWDSLAAQMVKNLPVGMSQDGGGIGRGDHFLSYKFIERTIEHWTNFTKRLLIASRGHQAPRKATHCLRREVGQNIKDKKGDKKARDGDPYREGSLNRGSFQSPGNPRAGGSEGSFQISEGNLTGRKN